MKILPDLLWSSVSAARARVGIPALVVSSAKKEVVPQASIAASATAGVTANDVIACIEMLLGRTPDPSLVKYHLGLGFPDRFALGKYMISTGEFQTRMSKITSVVRATSVFLGDRVLTSTHRGDAIYLVPLDLDLTPSIIRSGEWETHVERAIISSLRPGDICVDIGANVGYHTLAMAAAVGSDGEIHAFEANPELMRLLRATITVNGLDRVSLHETAALDRSETVKFASAPGHYGSGHVINEAYPAGNHLDYSIRMDVPAVTLDAVLVDRVRSVNLIHLDIEGAEPLALRGAERLIKRSPTVRIITEWSVAMMSSLADVSGFVAWLVELGFKFWLIERRGGLTRVTPSALSQLPLCDILLSRDHPP